MGHNATIVDFSDFMVHQDFCKTLLRSTLAHANEHRNWRIWADFAQALIIEARDLYRSDSFGVELAQTVYAFDSTTVGLCLSLFPWARFRKNVGAVKAHTLLDLRGNIPCWVHVTPGEVHDVNALNPLPIETGSFCILDRVYLDFTRLHDITTPTAFFITRAKSNTRYRRLSSHPVDRNTGLRCDQTIMLVNFNAHRDYPDKLRLVKFVDPETAFCPFPLSLFGCSLTLPLLFSLQVDLI